jgi:hypothetical protein
VPIRYAQVIYAVDGGPIEIRREGSQSGPVAYDQAAKIPVQVYQDNKDRSEHAEAARPPLGPLANIGANPTRQYRRQYGTFVTGS